MVVVVDTPSRRGQGARYPEKVGKADSPSPPKPEWIRVRPASSSGYADTRRIVKGNRLVTVCEEARCPNIGECWDKKHATFMILGDTCTRACTFCNVKTGLPDRPDPLEPERVAAAVAKLGLAHVVITSVDRDDLFDGGAQHFARTIRAIRRSHPVTTIEILTPDFLRKTKKEGLNRWCPPNRTCSIITSKPCLHIMAPFVRERGISIQFVFCSAFSYERVAYAKGFLMVSATPLTRSSHHAGEIFAKMRDARPRGRT